VATSSRRQVVLLSVLVAALLVIVWWNFIVPPAPLAPPSLTASARNAGPLRPAAPGVRSQTSAPGQVESLRLASLTADRPQPEGGERDPFRFGERQAPPRAAGDQPVAAVRPQPPVPTGPPPPPPITLKFIGVVDTADKRKIAVLSDGQNVFYGREGEIVEGRYRIQRISAESIEMAWADGTGHQVIRLSGS
jgi:hypothetical protein